MIGESSLAHIEGVGRFRPADARAARPVPAIVPVTDATGKGRDGGEPFVLPDQNQPRSGASTAYKRADGLGRYAARALDITVDHEGHDADGVFGAALRLAGSDGVEQAPSQAPIVVGFAYRNADSLDVGYAHRGSIFDLTI